jgi:peroxiredoxin
VTLVAISVDEPDVSRTWAAKKGFEFDLLADPELELIRRHGLENPEVADLSLHAVVIVDAEGVVLYRKIARTRAQVEELLAAVDHHRGEWSAE